MDGRTNDGQRTKSYTMSSTDTVKMSADMVDGCPSTKFGVNFLCAFRENCFMGRWMTKDDDWRCHDNISADTVRTTAKKRSRLLDDPL